MTLPAWLRGLPDPERVRAMDAWAIETRGIPGLQLMERAGAGLADVTTQVAPSGVIAVVCGTAIAALVIWFVRRRGNGAVQPTK